MASSTFIHHCYITTSFPIQGKIQGDHACVPLVARTTHPVVGRVPSTLVVVQLLSHVWLFVTPWTAAHQAPVLHYVPEFAQIHVQWVCDAIQPSYPLPPLLILPSVFPSIRVFSNDPLEKDLLEKGQHFALGGQSIGASASATVLPMNIQGWFPCWLDLLAVQGTLMSLLQHHNSKTSILQHSVFFMVRPSHPYVTTGKIIALTRRTFVGKVMSPSTLGMHNKHTWVSRIRDSAYYTQNCLEHGLCSNLILQLQQGKMKSFLSRKWSLATERSESAPLVTIRRGEVICPAGWMAVWDGFCVPRDNLSPAGHIWLFKNSWKAWLLCEFSQF